LIPSRLSRELVATNSEIANRQMLRANVRCEIVDSGPKQKHENLAPDLSDRPTRIHRLKSVITLSHGKTDSNGESRRANRRPSPSEISTIAIPRTMGVDVLFVKPNSIRARLTRNGVRNFAIPLHPNVRARRKINTETNGAV